MKKTMFLGKVQRLVLDGFGKHAGTEGITVDDLDKVLRLDGAQNLLGASGNRRCNHVSSQLKKRGLIEQCGVVKNGITRTGVYRAVVPNRVRENGMYTVVIPDPVAEAPAVATGLVVRFRNVAIELPPGTTLEFVADLRARLAELA